VTDEDIASLAATGDIQNAAGGLAEAALSGGGRDNVAVVVAEI